MEFTGSIIGVNIDVVTKEATVTFKVDNRQAVLDGYDELKGSRLTIMADKYRQKRSLDANAYFWVLAGKLASKLHTTTTEVYRQYIYDVGDNFRIVPIREDLKRREMEVENFIESLPKSKDRRIVRYRVLDGLSWPEVSHKMGRRYTPDSVRIRYNRIFEKNF